MRYIPKHSAARKQPALGNRVAMVAIAGSATFVTAIGLSAPAQAAGSVWDRVAACESTGNWAINSGNGYYGGLQFSSATWLGFGGGRYASYAHRTSRPTQIGIARRVLRVQGPGAWPVCGKRAGLTRANGGTARVFVSRSRARTAFVGGRLAVDGVMGPRTIREIQRWIGTRPDGRFGRGSVMALQRKVRVGPDGRMGSRTIRALQIRTGARRDGARYLNSRTVAALQRYLNSH